MKIAARTEYACLALLELAANFGGGELVSIRELAEKHGIPSRFLVQILLQLKAAGLVASTRGASGGYRLARSPHEITLAEVVAVMEGQPQASASQSQSSLAAALAGAWHEADQAQQQVLENFTLTELLDRAAKHSPDMYYI